MTSEIKVDTISEQTSANGVTIDGLTIKDGNIIGDVALAGTTPTFTIGDGGAEDAALIFDGNAQDFYIALDDSADDLIIGRGSTVGTSADIQLNADGDIGIATAPNNVDSGRTLHIKGHNSDGANIRLQSTGDTADTDDMVIQKNDTVGFIKLFGGDTFKVFTSGAERLAIDADGVVSITTSGNGDNLSLISTDADANSGPNLRLYRNSSSPADSDVLGQIEFEGRNDNSQDYVAAQIKTATGDVSDGTEDAQIEFDVMTAGTLREYLRMASGSEPSVVINEDGQDINFRVESDNQANMIFVDAGNDKVGIGLADPTGTFHVKTNNAGTTMYIEDSHAGNGDGPELYLYRNSSSPADNDDIGIMKFLGKNDAGQDVIYGQIKSIITDASDGTEDGKLEFYHMLNGSTAPSLQLTSDEVVINESSNDINFRVESNGNANMFKVDAGNNAIGIGSDPISNSMLHIKQAASGQSSVAANAEEFIIEDDDNCGMTILSGTGNTGTICFGDSGDDNIGQVQYHHAENSLKFVVNAAEKMRITDGGKVGIGNTSPAHALTVENSENAYSLSVKNNKNPSSSAPYIAIFRFHETPDNGTSEFLRCDDSVGSSAVARCIITSQGDLINHDNDYGQISDERIKDNIVDANSQWDDIKAIKVRNFERKDDIDQYGAGNKVQIGVIAQEIEQVSPGLVKESDPTADTIEISSEFGTLYTADDAETKDGEDAVLFTAEDQEVIDGDKNVGDVKIEATHSKKVNDVKSLTGEKLKKVSYSVLYMKAIKALQEAQTRIETLETKVAALEG